MPTLGFLLHGVAHSGNPWLDAFYSLVPFFLVVGAIVFVYWISEGRSAERPPDTGPEERHGDEPV